MNCNKETDRGGGAAGRRGSAMQEVEEVCGERGEKLRERSAMPQGSGSAREVWCERIMTGRRGLR